MKMLDIRREVSLKVAEYLAQGYILVDDDSSFGNICRYDLMKPKADTKLRIFLENEREYDEHYLNKVIFKIVVMLKDETFIRENNTVIFNKTFYSVGRAKDWYSEDVQDALAAEEKMVDRYMHRYYRDSILTTNPSDNLLRLLRKNKGFGKCNATNTVIWRTECGYKVETTFAGRTHTKRYKFPSRELQD